MRQGLDAGCELDERAELGVARDAARDDASGAYSDATDDQGSSWSCFNPSEIFRFSASTRSTLTVISSPGFTRSDGFATLDQPISET